MRKELWNFDRVRKRHLMLSPRGNNEEARGWQAIMASRLQDPPHHVRVCNQELTGCDDGDDDGLELGDDVTEGVPDMPVTYVFSLKVQPYPRVCWFDPR